MADQAPMSVADARAHIAGGRVLAAQAEQLRAGEVQLRGDVEQAYNVLREQMVQRELSSIPIARLRDTTSGRLRLGPLEQLGITSVLHVYDAPAWRLEQVPGIGPKTANQLVGAARQVATAVRDGLKVRVDLDTSDKASSALIEALHHLREYELAVRPVREPAERLASELSTFVQVAGPAGSRWKRFFSGRERRGEADAALAQVVRLVEGSVSSGLNAGVKDAYRVLANRPPPAAAWREFQSRSPEFYGLLGEIVQLGGDDHAAAGFLPAELVERIAAHPLDDSFSRVSLRGYQAFGARFALAQRRVIIGDEMGLGKTIQAIAVIAHLRSGGASRFLVACPASVLVNWTREVHERSALRAYRLHGPDRVMNQRAWERDGGVAVTTLDSLHALNVAPEIGVDQLIIDEAHYVKNPQARRSRAVAEWTRRVHRVLFLSGTPMENRVEEFRNLVGYLQPQVATRVAGRDGVAGPTAFRRAVAPVYLRRNQDDVLMELPDLIRSDEWVEFGRDDFAAYREAVAQGNFMAMRRAAFAPGTPAGSAKLTRLLEIVRESAENGLKVVIFTNFRDVLSAVHSSLQGAVFGPISGSVPPDHRQQLIDEFTAADGHAVLLAQIQAGGTGLNIQAASVAIICEPQVKPSLEEQAIARLHRMGQVRVVQTHRLLVAGSVDQRMVEILRTKAQLFDEYARRSDMAEGSPDAVDVSEVELARTIVAEEQERLAREMMAEYEQNPDDEAS